MKRILAIVFMISTSISLYPNSNSFNMEEYTAEIVPTNESPDIDGIIHKEEWKNAQVFKNFWDHWPSDTSQSKFQTEVRITYDDAYLYIAVQLNDNDRSKIIQTLKRDSEREYWNSDAFAIILDPINSKSNGYLFGVNAGGAQFDGLVSVEGSYNSIDANWDNIWFSDVSVADDHWEIEIAIPFSSLKYDTDNREWGINFVRNDIKRNVYSTWTRFPTNFQGIDLGHTGSITFSKLPSTSTKKFSFTPSMLGNVERNNADGIPTRADGNIGLDSKIAISSSLNLDVTVNPDFSQVEVDQQVTNLSRFNPYFPEKRNFFLENSDLFSNLGSDQARPIFTRKIGLKDGENIPIILGTRLSGNLTENLRIGLMDIQTAEKSDLSAENYAIGSVQQKVLKRSNIKAFLVNRQAVKENTFSANDYNRVGGLEFNYLSENGKVRGSAIYHNSFTPEKYSSSGFYSAGAAYNSKKFFSSLYLYQMDKNYIADVGFTPRLYNYDAARDSSIRLGYKEIYSRNNFKMYPNSDKISMHGITGSARLYYNTQNVLTEYTFYGSYFLNFKNQSWIYTQLSLNMVKLPFATEIISSDNPLPAQRYDYINYFIQYKTTPVKKLGGRFYGSYGSFFNGTKLTAGTEITYRTQPWGNFSVNYQFDQVELAKGYGSKDLHLIGAKTQISFSKKLFWTTFLQYHTQAENFNINSRIQWRYKPMSDIYFVVTNNYNSYDFTQKNLMFALKINYYFNI